ncbi:MAG: transglutaminase domain-containing protein [Bacillota bacterium]|nr:transglutaminase domain-containing protein [Bacillota bacterium]
MKKYISNLKFQIVPLLFSVNCTYWTMSSLMRIPPVAAIISIMLLNTFFFLWFDKEKDAGKKGNTRFLFGTVLFMFLVFVIIMISDEVYSSSYLDWFKSTGPDSRFFAGYSLATLLLLGYFFASTVYYFSQVIFRLTVLFLISIVPLLLQTINTKMEINLFFILFLILFFFMYVERVGKGEGTGGSCRKEGYGWYLGAVTAFVGIILLAAVILPKPERLPRMSSLDTVLSCILKPVNDSAKDSLLGENKESSLFNPMKLRRTANINDVQLPVSDRVIYEVQAEEPLYFRVQTWDKYDSNRWYIGNRELENGYTVESQSTRQMKLFALLPLLERASNSGVLDSKAADIDSILKAPSFYQEKKYAYVTAKDYAVQSYLNTPGIMSIRGESNGLVYMDRLDSTYLGSQKSPGSNESYRIQYISQSLVPASRQARYVQSMNSEKYEFIENTLLSYSSGHAGDKGFTLTEQEKSVLRYEKAEMEEAKGNFTELPDNLPKRVYDLAEKLTAGKSSDYDKAAAIEDYFHSTDFKYDLYAEKAPEGRDCNDYFIFEEKQGGCVQFASAMVILARAAGLPARYVEGFVADEKDAASGKYIIRESDAHAFPEIYISGFGWRIFEPTSNLEVPKDSLTGYFNDAFKGIGFFTNRIALLYNRIPMYLRILFVPLIFVSLFLGFYIFFNMKRKFWKRRLSRMPKRGALEEILRRMEAMLGRVNMGKKLHETPAVYASRIGGELKISIEGITNIYNNVKYGDIEPSEEDMNTALSKYEEVRLYVKNFKGRLKGWLL